MPGMSMDVYAWWGCKLWAEEFGQWLIDLDVDDSIQGDPCPRSAPRRVVTAGPAGNGGGSPNGPVTTGAGVNPAGQGGVVSESQQGRNPVAPSRARARPSPL